jgi:hypothetical protein
LRFDEGDVVGLAFAAGNCDGAGDAPAPNSMLTGLLATPPMGLGEAFPLLERAICLLVLMISIVSPGLNLGGPLSSLSTTIDMFGATTGDTRLIQFLLATLTPLVTLNSPLRAEVSGVLPRLLFRLSWASACTGVLLLLFGMLPNREFGVKPVCLLAGLENRPLPIEEVGDEPQ